MHAFLQVYLVLIDAEGKNTVTDDVSDDAICAEAYQLRMALASHHNSGLFSDLNVLAYEFYSHIYG